MPQSKVSAAIQPDEQDEIEEVEDTQPIFNVDKYRISSSPEKRTLTIDGTSFDVTIKPLSWSMRNQILSRSLKWDNSGNTNFDGDAYVRECLKEMLIDAPWGRTTEPFLVSIDSRLGGLLETLVPKAFDEDDALDVEQVKKGR